MMLAADCVVECCECDEWCARMECELALDGRSRSPINVLLLVRPNLNSEALAVACSCF